MTAVLLAAGRGTRMGALTANTPKPLLHLRGRPILEHIIIGLRAAGIDRFVVVTGYLGEQIESRFGDGRAARTRILYRRQARAEGTGRALALVRDAVGELGPFVLSWGDVVVDAEVYGSLLRQFHRQPSDVLLAVNPCEDPWRGAAVYVDAQWRVTQLIEKPPVGTSRTPWNNAGIFVFSPIVFEYAARLVASPRGEYELPQAIAAMIADGRAVYAYPIRGFWSDLGTPADLGEAERLYQPHPEAT